MSYIDQNSRGKDHLFHSFKSQSTSADSLPPPIQQLLLTSQLILEINHEARILLVFDQNSHRMLGLKQFTKNEWVVLMQLLREYPNYVPNEILLASLTSLSVEECQALLQKAQLIGKEAVKRELKPVYRSIAGVRTKLQKIFPQLRVIVIRETGYALISSSTYY